MTFIDKMLYVRINIIYIFVVRKVVKKSKLMRNQLFVKLTKLSDAVRVFPQHYVQGLAGAAF